MRKMESRVAGRGTYGFAATAWFALPLIQEHTGYDEKFEPSKEVGGVEDVAEDDRSEFDVRPRWTVCDCC